MGMKDRARLRHCLQVQHVNAYALSNRRRVQWIGYNVALGPGTTVNVQVSVQDTHTQTYMHTYI